jgi:endonuclease/exonuclease/phosphatase family metal-dependent hydrolase
MHHHNQENLLKIATFNLFNLVNPNERYYGKRVYTEEQFNKKKDWIVEQFDKLDADVIGFQEVFHEEALRAVMLAHPKYKNAHLVMGERKGGSPAVALISKHPIVSHESFTDFPEQLVVEGAVVPFKEFSRPILKAAVEVRPGTTIEFFVGHLKSKRPLIPHDVKDRYDPLEISKGQARSLLLRAAEANALRTILLKSLRNRKTPVIVLGDLNDTHTSVTTQIISGQTPPRHWPVEHKKKLWDIVLYHSKDIQARQSSTDVYYTHIHNGHYESLDHIMVSEELVKENPNRIGRVIFVRTFNDHIVDETLSEDEINYWQSDHAQVVATIELENPRHN